MDEKVSINKVVLMRVNKVCSVNKVMLMRVNKVCSVSVNEESRYCKNGLC